LSPTTLRKVRGTATRLLLVGLFVAIAACGPSRSAGRGGPRNQITRSQIAAVTDRSAYSLIRFLKPRWLEARVMATPRNPEPAYAHVYVDNLAYGPLLSLYDISSISIDRIDYMGSLDATTRFGTGFLGGIIHIFTRAGR